MKFHNCDQPTGHAAQYSNGNFQLKSKGKERCNLGGVIFLDQSSKNSNK